MKPMTVAAACAALLLAACGDESRPVAGDLAVTASTAPVGARAVLLRIVGPVNSVTAPPGAPHRVYATTTADTTKVAVIAPIGVTLTAGPLLRISVPDTRRAAAYTVTALQASSASYQLIGPAFTFTVATP